MDPYETTPNNTTETISLPNDGPLYSSEKQLSSNGIPANSEDPQGNIVGRDLTFGERLQDIGRIVDDGGQPRETVRTFISWYYRSQRRGRSTVSLIRSELDAAGLQTVPDFNDTYLDGEIAFVRKVPASNTGAVVSLSTTADDRSDEPAIAVTSNSDNPPANDPTYRLSRLKAANTAPLRIKPDTTVTEAVTLMLGNDYSQLPVMTSDYVVKGIFSWKSLGSRLALGRACDFVRQCMDKHHEVRSETSLFYAIDEIVRYECVLVKDASNKVCGLVTTSDISVQFRQLAEPFLLLAEIENFIRDVLSDAFTTEELKTARNPKDSEREVKDASDLTMGEYVMFLQKVENWSKLDIKIDRNTFTAWLDEVRVIRNDVMHFDPDGIAEASLATLQNFNQFLQRLRELLPRKRI